MAVNVSVAGICAECPYRGGYCPGVCQLYFAPFLSMVMYRDTERGSGARSFKVNLALLGVFGIGSYIFGFYWLFRLYWQEHSLVVLGLLALLLLHMPLSFFMLCPKCGYNDTCPISTAGGTHHQIDAAQVMVCGAAAYPAANTGICARAAG